jgi:branched-chain amino acid aminotransferase
VTCPDPTASAIVYLNGEFVPLEEARISPLDRGFQYGDGVFETLRAQSGRILFLAEHLQRLSHSLAELRLPQSTGDWQTILAELLSRNALTNGVAAVKIIITRGVAAQLGLPRSTAPTLLVQARSYDAPSAEQYRRGWRLHLFRQGFAPPLAGHKSLNYLFYLVARQAALDAGADEAVLLDAQARVTETAAGSLLVRTDGQWWTPRSPHQLPGTTLRQVARMLRDRGQVVPARAAGKEDLASAQTIWVLNSLLGIMPVTHLEDRPMPQVAAAEAAELREVLFARE